MGTESLGSAVLDLETDASGLKRGMNEAKGVAQRGMNDMQKSADKMGKTLMKAFSVTAILLAGRAIVRVGKDLVAAFEVQEQAEARLAGVIRATGMAAGQSAAEMQNFASSLQGVTTFGDEAIIGMQAVLATFREIKGDVFDRTTEIALDLSATLGQDLRSSAIMLGKALQDPIVGLTAMSRAGITFTDTQKDMIRAMQEAGDMAGAQTLILDELEMQMGGVARTVADTATGAMKQLSNALGDMRERTGGFLAVAARPFVTWLTEIVTEGNAAAAAMETLRDAFSATTNAQIAALDVSAAISAQQDVIAAATEILRIKRISFAEDTRAVEAAKETVFVAEQRLRILLNTQIVQRNIRTEQQAIAAAAEAAAEEAERQAEAARIAALAYGEAVDFIQATLDSQLTQSDILQEQIGFLETFVALDAEIEASRLRALGILEDQLAVLQEQAEVVMNTVFADQQREALADRMLELQTEQEVQLQLVLEANRRRAEAARDAALAEQEALAAMQVSAGLAAARAAESDRSRRDLIARIRAGQEADLNQLRQAISGQGIAFTPPEAAAGPAAMSFDPVIAAVMTGLSLLATEMDSLAAIMDPVSLIFSGFVDTAGPAMEALNEALKPVVGALVMVGRLLGMVLAPVFELLAVVIEPLTHVFVFLFNAMRPLVSIFIFITNIIRNLGQFITNIVNRPFAPWTWGSGMINPFAGTEIPAISTDDLTVAGGDVVSGIGGGGAGATFQQQRPIIVTVNVFDNQVFGGNLQEFGIIIRDQILDINELGL